MQLKAGSSNNTIYVSVADSTSTTGGKKTGLAYNTAGLKCYYTRTGAAATSITLATQTVTGAYSSGGFVEIDSANSPGLYRFDIPAAVVATGAKSVILSFSGATGMVQTDVRLELITVDFQDSVRFGLTALPNASAGATGGLNVISGAKNVASTFDFLMIDSTTGQGATGATIAVNIYKDGVSGSFTGSVTEIGNGVYSYAATAADLNADRITFQFNAAGCYTQTVSISTK